MGARRDASLAVLVLAGAAIALVVVDASPSIVAAVAGGVGTVGFEVVAHRDRALVRRYWEQPLVQAVAVGIALGGIGVGAWAAPSAVLSFVLGALITYLGYLLVATALR